MPLLQMGKLRHRKGEHVTLVTKQVAGTGICVQSLLT